MCENAVKTLGELFVPISDSILAILNDLGQGNSLAGQTIAAELASVQADLANYTPGSAASDTIQILGDISTALGVLASTTGIPTATITLIQIAIGGVQAIVGILTGNAPAPAGTAQAQYTSHVMAQTFQTIKTVVPGFHYHKGIFAKNAGTQYKEYWNKECDTIGKPALKLEE